MRCGPRRRGSRLPPSAELELFHQIADEGSARVRRFVVEHELTEAVRFRNVVYEAPQQRLAELGGTVPALWDGDKLFVGADAVISRLKAHLDVGREK